MRWLVQTIFGPALSEFSVVLFLSLFVACAGLLPGALKSELRVGEALKTLRAECGYYSALIREENEERDRRRSERQIARENRNRRDWLRLVYDTPAEKPARKEER